MSKGVKGIKLKKLIGFYSSSFLYQIMFPVTKIRVKRTYVEKFLPQSRVCYEATSPRQKSSLGPPSERYLDKRLTLDKKLTLDKMLKTLNKRLNLEQKVKA